MFSRLRDSPSGRLVLIDDRLSAYIPDALPRHIELDASLVYRLDEASQAVATLAGVGETIPNLHLLLTPFMRRKAVPSSRIEGTQATLDDLFLYEASRRSREDVPEVLNYVMALPCCQSAKVGHIETREDCCYEEPELSFLRALL